MSSVILASSASITIAALEDFVVNASNGANVYYHHVVDTQRTIGLYGNAHCGVLRLENLVHASMNMKPCR